MFDSPKSFFGLLAIALYGAILFLIVISNDPKINKNHHNGVPTTQATPTH